jgi:hypothetical protein
VRTARSAGLASVADRCRGRGVRPLPEVLVRRTARSRIRGTALAQRMGRWTADARSSTEDVGSRTDRALPGTGRVRRAAARACLRRHPPRRVDLARRGIGRATSTAPSGNPRRRDLGPGLLRTGGRLRPCQPSHVGSAYRRLLRRQWPEAVGQRWYACRLVPAAGPHRSGCAQAQRNFVLPARHDHNWRRRAAHPQRHRRFALLRDISSTTCRFPPRTLSARRTPDGKWRRRRWAPNVA